jgi:hypothetical protein
MIFSLFLAWEIYDIYPLVVPSHGGVVVLSVSFFKIKV